MIQPQTLKTIFDYIKGAWTALGPLVGLLVGAWLARSSDREKWLKDNRKQECKELLSAITHAATLKLRVSLRDGVEMRHEDDAYLESLKVFYSRIFIAKDVEKYKLLDSWAHAVRDLNTSRDRSKFSDKVEEISKKIIDIAMRE